MIGIMIAGAVAAHANEKSWDDKFKNAYVAYQNAIEQDWTDAGCELAEKQYEKEIKGVVDEYFIEKQEALDLLKFQD